MNWWLDAISDDVHWDVDGLSILDPRQIDYVIELCDSLRDYGFDLELIDRAFYAFAIDHEIEPGKVRLVRVKESFLEGEEKLFALPDILDEDKGPYADFLDQITKARVKLLNDLIDFEQSLTIDELEEEIRERQGADYFEGRAVHFFQEITAILEYVPEGYELDEEESSVKSKGEDEEIVDLPDFEDTEEEVIEEDETMKWDDEENEEDDDLDDEFFEDEEDDLEADEEEENYEKRPRRGRRDAGDF